MRTKFTFLLSTALLMGGIFQPSQVQKSQRLKMTESTC